MATDVILDVSSYQHPTTQPITWAKVAADPVRVIGVVLKATQGTTYVNPFYAQDLAGALANHIPAMAYHYADFTTAQAEAAHFFAVAAQHARALDVETSPDITWMNAFWAALPAEPLEETYGSASTLPRAVKSGLWAADYTSNPGFGTLWQAGDNLTVAGIPAPVDYSVWLASPTAFNLFFSTSTPTPTPTPPTPTGGSMITVPVSTDSNGDGWTLTDIPWTSFFGVTGQGSYPPVDGYWGGITTAQERTGRVLVNVRLTNKPNSEVLAFVNTVG